MLGSELFELIGRMGFEQIASPSASVQCWRKTDKAGNSMFIIINNQQVEIYWTAPKSIRERFVKSKDVAWVTVDWLYKMRDKILTNKLSDFPTNIP